MYGGIVEFYALTDSDGSGTKHDNLFTVGKAGFILILIGGVEIGDIRADVCGVNHTEHGDYAVFLSLCNDVKLGTFPKLCDVFV